MIKVKFGKRKIMSSKPQLHKEIKEKIYSLECPYCYTIMIGGHYMDKNVLVYRCSQCGYPILLDKENEG